MSLYLTRLILNIRNRAVQHDITNCQAMHRRVMSGFNDDIASATPRSQIGVLYRLETANDNMITLLIQSNQEPDWSKLPKEYITTSRDEPGGNLLPPLSVREITTVLERLLTNQRYRFQLFACPCKKIGTNTKEELQRGIKNNGKRIPLKTPEEKETWIKKKGDEHGFRVLIVEMDPKPPIYGKRKSYDEDYMKHQGVYYRGILQITNLEQFKESVKNGIGPAKSYGFGMIMISSTN